MTDDLELYTRSDEVQEIMNYVPHWIVRGGITIVFITILMLLVVSWLIKYPDVIKARVTVMSQTPPIKVVARSTGKLTLYVKDHDAVIPGAILAVIESFLSSIINGIPISFNNSFTNNSDSVILSDLSTTKNSSPPTRPTIRFVPAKLETLFASSKSYTNYAK